MFATLSAVFWGIVTFSILVVLHEGGHFLTARAFGVHVHEFMIGLPGPAIRYHGKKTDYGITAIPLGGYVRISGMEPGPEDPLLGPGARVRHPQRIGDRRDRSPRRWVSTPSSAEVAAVHAGRLERDRAPRRTPRTSIAPSSSADLAENPVALLDKARSTTYRGLSTFKRILVLSAGVAVNLARRDPGVRAGAHVVRRADCRRSPSRVRCPTAPPLQPGSSRATRSRSWATRTLKDWPALLAALEKMKPGDVVVRHGRPRRRRPDQDASPWARTRPAARSSASP